MHEKKRIAVVTSDVPFVQGGHLVIARSTVRALRESGYEADLVLTPQNRFGFQFRAYLATRLTDLGMDGLGRKIDQVISFRFPSFAVRHPHHVCWLNHRLREYYDLWEDLCSQLSLRTRVQESLRRILIRALDTYLLKHNVTKLFAQSKTIQHRLRKWGNIPSQVLYPPPPYREYRTDSYQNFVFSVSRLQRLKRLDLLIAAFRHVKNKDLKAIIIGEGPEAESLYNQIRSDKLEGRITLLGAAEEGSIIDHYARCLAVFFAPLREDYGLVTAESFASKKAVVTTLDSGGPAELVKDGVRGYVVEAEPEKIAEKLDELSMNPSLAETMGHNAHEFISGISWEKTVERLIIRD